MDGRQNFVELNQLGALLRVFFRVEPLDGNLRKVRIGVITRAILVSQPLGLDLHLQRLGRLEAVAAHVEILDDVQHLQGRQPLRVGRHGVYIDAAILRYQRLDPLGVVFAQILG